MPLCIRQATATDDLSAFFGLDCPLRWNLQQVYVADDAGRIVGLALVFDGGHDIVMVDHVRVLPPWEGRAVWVRLLARIAHDMRGQGKRALMGYADSAAVLGMATHYGGAVVGKTTYRALHKEL